MFDIFRKKNTVQPVGESPYLIVGLGNPGREYRGNRHNVGFMAVEAFAKDIGVTFTRVQSNALVVSTAYEGKRLVLAKPQTFMNLSGQAVSALVRFHKVPLERLLVLHDDLDLPFGTLRMRPGGGAGGQKGLTSIIERLGTQDFPRLRLGIGRPPGRMEAADYVLQDFSVSEKDVLPALLSLASKATLTFLTAGIEQAMNQYNGELSKG